MTRRSLVFTGFAVLLSACQTPYEGAVYNSVVMQAMQQRGETLKRQRATLQFESDASARTCDEYLRLIATGRVKEGVANELVKSEYLVCDVVALAGAQKLGRRHPGDRLGQALAERVDLRSFPSSLHQMLDEKKFSLKLLDAQAVTTDATSASYDTQDWHYRLELVAALDANGNGKPDWVVWLTDEAREGNYRHYQTLVIYDVPETGRLRAVPYVNKARTAAPES